MHMYINHSCLVSLSHFSLPLSGGSSCHLHPFFIGIWYWFVLSLFGIGIGIVYVIRSAIPSICKCLWSFFQGRTSMVAATQQQQQHHHQYQPQPQPQPSQPSAEEDALKRNTDCVYFLASPLTCKKGSECEYRHSEYARINPRDCYFWMNGNCLNPKCGFRHPPLDGLFGTQSAASAGTFLPPSHTVVAPASHAPDNSGKQPVSCHFFQKGLCLKGDRCAFLHGPNPTSNKLSQPMATTSVSEQSMLKKSYGGVQKCTQEQKIPLANFPNALVVTPVSKPAPKAEVTPPRIGVAVEKTVLPTKSMDGEVPEYKATNLPFVVSANSSRANRLHQSQVVDDHVFQNGKDADEFLRESSPGFDVLVDDELRGSDYYHGEDQYGRARVHEGRNLNSVDEYNMGANYSSMVDIDQETYRDPRVYESYERLQGQYPWEQHRASSERMLVGPAHLERGCYSKADNPEYVDESDLRYHLSKQRRVNGLRSVVSHDFVPDEHVGERGDRSSSRRDSHHLPSHESPLISRLRGRIKLPRGSPNNGSDLRVGKEVERGRNWGRLSPGRSRVASQQGRFCDRIKGRVEEDSNERRNFGCPWVRREIMDDRNTDFAGPKSLAELKAGKNVEGRVRQSLGKRKHMQGDQPSEADLSFEGPLPLSEILKKKREAEAAASGGGISSVNVDNYNHKDLKESSISNLNNTAVAERQGSMDEDSQQMLKGKEESPSADTADIATTVENEELTHGHSSQLPNQSEFETEDGMIFEDGVEEQYDGDEQRDGDYEYEHVDEGDYNYEEEGENADAEEEYVDDDGDHFAKKIDVMFS